MPPQYLDKLKEILDEFDDRFSKSKLDIEITDMYEADLDTTPGKIANQRVRRLPENKYQFAMKAIKQLEEAGVVSESDSEWRSNVVMVPKPVGKNELRSNTKSDMQDKDKQNAQLYRICLDFKELNEILIFPKQVQFVNLDTLLYTLKGKLCINSN
jgi:negative regulator of genetic competence, sporulation and motility